MKFNAISINNAIVYLYNNYTRSHPIYNTFINNNNHTMYYEQFEQLVFGLEYFKTRLQVYIIIEI